MARNAVEKAGHSRSPSGRKKRRSKSRGRRDRSKSVESDRSDSGSRKKRTDKKKRASSDDKRSRSKKKGKKNRSRSRKARSKSRKARSKSRKARSRSGKRKRSPSKNRSASRKRSSSKSGKKKGSPSRKTTAGAKKPSSPKTAASPQRAASSSGDDRSSPRRSLSRSADKNGSHAANADAMAAGTDASQRPAADPPKEAEAPKPVVMELTTVTLSERPFGMSPSKDEAGYVVAKLADGRPADQAGVQVGWRLMEVGGKSCKDLGLDAIQALLKSAELPVQAVFERPAVQDEPSDDEEDNDGEFDILDARAEHRMKHAGALANIDDLPIKREPEGLPEPIKSWQDAVNKNLLNKALLDKLQAAGLKRPTPIQRHAVPIISHQSGYHDMIALAQTGSGKTFAFVIPTVARLVMQGAMPRPFFPGKSPGCPLMLALSPTRELAMQTSKEIEVLTKGTSLSQICVYGGESLKFQQQRIEKAQIDILCATPGRLIDLIDSGKISLSFIQSVVLDEADQMLEQSLEIMCAEILTGRDMPDPKSGRQTLLFSATMPQKIRDMCPKILRTERIANLTIGHYGDNQGGSCSSIKQLLRWAPDETSRIPMLVEDLRRLWMADGKKGRVVVFTNQRLQAGHLANSLQNSGISCVHLHGKLDQHVREEVFEKFRRGQGDVLVATNVASRGLDFPDISFVVQFNMPQTIDIYTHRIGRTGRVGQVGCALAYVGPKDRHLTPKLIEFLELNKQEVPHFLQTRRASPPRRGGRSRSRRRR
mmetsp:Transcript_87193/g.244669  ORF Transcript_87193/g.244669 Transcript_87193/m.244669 type:complete len:765 (+) Transcript_87193:41-2335(+)